MSLIINEEHYQTVQSALTESQSVKLEKQLDYLRNYGGGRFEVHLGYDSARWSFSVLWLYTEGRKVFMQGGLIYHPDDDDWSVHT